MKENIKSKPYLLIITTHNEGIYAANPILKGPYETITEAIKEGMAEYHHRTNCPNWIVLDLRTAEIVKTLGQYQMAWAETHCQEQYKKAAEVSNALHNQGMDAAIAVIRNQTIETQVKDT